MDTRQVRDVMTKDVVTLQPMQSIHEAAQVLADGRISAAPVVVDGRVIGLVSEADLLRALLPGPRVDRGVSLLDMFSIIGRGKPVAHHGVAVREIMSEFVVEVPLEMSIWKAAEIMDRRGIKRLPVTDGTGKLVGIVSRADIVKAIGRTDEQIAVEAARAIAVLGDEVFSGLSVTVDDGVTTLRGTADRRSTRDIAVRIAAGVPGVTEVIDRMEFGFDDSSLKTYRSPDDPKDPRLDWERKEANV